MSSWKILNNRWSINMNRTELYNIVEAAHNQAETIYETLLQKLP